jgi:hypothetical protein
MEAKEETKVQPNNTLYVRNLNEKIKLEGKPVPNLPCRNAREPLPPIFAPRRSDSSADARDSANEGLGIRSLPITITG